MYQQEIDKMFSSCKTSCSKSNSLEMKIACLFENIKSSLSRDTILRRELLHLNFDTGLM